MGTTCLDAVAFVERLKASFRDSTPATSSFLRNHLSLWPKQRFAQKHMSSCWLLNWIGNQIIGYNPQAVFRAKPVVFAARWSVFWKNCDLLVCLAKARFQAKADQGNNEGLKESRPPQWCFYCFVLFTPPEAVFSVFVKIKSFVFLPVNCSYQVKERWNKIRIFWA